MATTTASRPWDWREGRRLRAWELKQQGWTQALIAAALGVTSGAVSQWMRRVPSQSRGQPANMLSRAVIACIACAAVAGCVVAGLLPLLMWKMDVMWLRLGWPCGDIGGSLSCLAQVQALQAAPPPQTALPVAHIAAIAILAIVVRVAVARQPNHAPVALGGAVLATLASFALAFESYSLQFDVALGARLRDALLHDGYPAAAHDIQHALLGPQALWASLPAGLTSAVFYVIAALVQAGRRGAGTHTGAD